MVVVGMVGVIAASGLGNYLRARPWNRGFLAIEGKEGKEGKTGAGITTEMAILVMYAVGVFVVFGAPVVAVAATGAVVLLLHAKDLLHRFVDSLGEKDVHGIMQFVVLAFIILPILPDSHYGPYGALNPRQIWMVVVLVVGISLGGYIMYKVVGERAGTALSGLLGGVISSTATTVSFARRSAGVNGSVASSATLAIMLASVVVYGRLFIELSAVAPRFMNVLAPPLGAMGVVTLVLALTMYIAGRRNRGDIPPQENPTNLKGAFFFAGIYGAVVLASAVAHDKFGNSGLYVVAAISGLSDMDAITLSSGRAVTEGRLAAGEAWRVIVVALMSSMVMKVVICAMLGSWRLTVRLAALFAVNIAAGALIMVYWPTNLGVMGPEQIEPAPIVAPAPPPLAPVE